MSGEKKTTIVIDHFAVVKELCANLGINLKGYINWLIRQDIMVNRNEYFNERYFKGGAGRR